MSAHPKIWFLRHGQTEWNRAFRLQGHLDSPLTDQGIAEAAQQAQVMPEVLAQKPDILVSPLGRAQQTAQIALDGASFQTGPGSGAHGTEAMQAGGRGSLAMRFLPPTPISPRVVQRRWTSTPPRRAGRGCRRFAGGFARCSIA